jgi:Sec-independent protein translocase protein TatA
MITVALLLLFLGYVVFGPKKTIEISQTLARTLAELKRAASQLQAPDQNRAGDQSLEMGVDGAARRS